MAAGAAAEAALDSAEGNRYVREMDAFRVPAQICGSSSRRSPLTIGVADPQQDATYSTA
jgi:hypothetical protein